MKLNSPMSASPFGSFLLACLLGTMFAAAWLWVGEPWEVLADGRHYVAMYRGEPAAAPFAYRILVPAVARSLAWDMHTSFAIVTLGCLILTTGVLALYAIETRVSWFRGLTMCAFWGLSFPFAYYATTRIRADAPMLLLLVVTYWLSHRRVPAIAIASLVALGGLSHELMLVCLPALWLDKVFLEEGGGGLTGGARYHWRELALISAIPLVVLLGARLVIPALSGQVSYATASPLNMFVRVLEYSGGPVKLALRIYAALGPAALFAIFFALSRRASADAKSFAGLGLIAIGATLFANDTLRVLEIFCVPALLFAACYLESLWRAGMRTRALVLVAVQASYSYVVYGHLRTFESSRALNVTAALLSLVALGLCLTASLGRPPRIQGERAVRALAPTT